MHKRKKDKTVFKCDYFFTLVKKKRKELKIIKTKIIVGKH